MKILDEALDEDELELSDEDFQEEESYDAETAEEHKHLTAEESSEFAKIVSACVDMRTRCEDAVQAIESSENVTGHAAQCLQAILCQDKAYMKAILTDAKKLNNPELVTDGVDKALEDYEEQMAVLAGLRQDAIEGEASEVRERHAKVYGFHLLTRRDGPWRFALEDNDEKSEDSEGSAEALKGMPGYEEKYVEKKSYW